MPLYQFQCRDCEDTFEVRRSFAQATEPAACRCGSENTRKLLNAVAFSMGSGGASRSKPSIPLPMQGGGCCGGGGCGCH